MANPYVINAALKFNVTTSSLTPVVAALQQKLANRPINIPVNLKISQNLTANLVQQNSAFKAFNRTLNSTANAAQKTALNIRQIGAAVRAVNRSFQAFNTGIGQFATLSTQISKVNQSLNNTGKSFASSNQQATSFYASIGLAIRRFAAFSVAAASIAGLVYQFHEATRAALEFDRELVRLRQVGGDTKATVKNIADEITRLSVNYGASSSELVKVASTLRQAGLSATETKTALASLAKTTLSPSFDNISNTVEGAIAIMAQFKTGAKDLEDQLGSLSQVSADTAAESSDLVEVIKRAGAAYKAAGGNLNELFATFTSIRATTRESAESIATGLRTILARLQDPEINKKLKSYGVNLYDLKGQFIGPYQAAQKLHDALVNLSPRDSRFTSILKDIGGLRQLSRVLPFIQETELASKALYSATKGSGKLEKDAVLAQEALLVSLSKLKEGFLELFRIVSQDKGIRSFFNTLVVGVSTLNTALKELKPLVPVLAGIALFAAARSIPRGFGQFKAGLAGQTYRLSTGGKVPNSPGSGMSIGTDHVPALLTPGEFVINRASAKAIGRGALEKLNRVGHGAFIGGFTGGVTGGTSGALMGALSGGAAGLFSRRRRYAGGGEVSRFDKLKEKYGPDMAQHILEIQTRRNIRGPLVNPDYLNSLDPEGRSEALMQERYAFKNRARNLIEMGRVARAGYNIHEMSDNSIQNAFKKIRTPTSSSPIVNNIVRPISSGSTATATLIRGTSPYLPVMKNREGILKRFLRLFQRHATGGTVAKLQELLNKFGIPLQAKNFIQGEHKSKSQFGGQYFSTSGLSTYSRNHSATRLHEFAHGLDFVSAKATGLPGFASETSGHPHNKLAKLHGIYHTNQDFSVIHGPTGGSAGLMSYDPSKHSRESFANAFAAHHIATGIEQGTIPAEHYPAIHHLLNDTGPQGDAFRKSRSLIEDTIQPRLQQIPYRDNYPQRGSTERIQTAKYLRDQRAANSPTVVTPTPISGRGLGGRFTKGNKPVNPRGPNGRFTGGKKPPPPNFPTLPILSDGDVNPYDVGPQGVPYKIAASSSGGPQPRLTGEARTQAILQNGQTPIWMQRNHQAPSLAAASSHFGLNDNSLGTLTTRGDLPKQKYVASLQGPRGNLYATSVKATSERAARSILEAGGASVRSIKQIETLGGQSKKWFSTLKDFFVVAGQSAQQVTQTVGAGNTSVTGGGGAARFSGRGKGLAIGAGLLAAGGVTYLASQHPRSTASNVLSGALGGASTGLAAGLVTSNPYTIGGAVVVGAGVGAYGAYNQQKEDERKKIIDEHQRTVGGTLGRVNPRTGRFFSSAEAESFNTSIGSAIYQDPDLQPKKKPGKLRRVFDRSLLGIPYNAAVNATVGYFNKRLHLLKTPQEKLDEARVQNAPIAEGLGNTVRNIREQSAKSHDTEATVNAKIKPFIDQLSDPRLGEVGKETLKDLAAEKERLDLTNKINEAIAHSTEVYLLSASKLEDFSKTLDHASEQFSLRGQYSSLGGNALAGHLTAAPSNVNLGNLGGADTVPGALHAFGKAGGGYDTAKQELQKIIESVSKGSFGLEPGGNAAEIEKRFRGTAVGQTDFGEQIANRITELGGEEGFDAKVHAGKTHTIVNEAFEPVKHIPELYNQTNQKLQQTYGFTQQQDIESRNKKFESDKNKAAIDAQRIEGHINPLSAINAVRGDVQFNGKRGITAEERGIDIEQQTKREAFNASNASLLRIDPNLAGGINSGNLKSAINTNQEKLSTLKSEREKAINGGVGLGEGDEYFNSIKKFDDSIHQTEDQIRRLGTVMGKLANDTTSLEAAQKKYALAVNQAQGDLNSRKSDADILTFGSQEEKQQLFQKESLTQQALQLNPEQFQQLPDQIRKIVGERLKEAPDRVRVFQGFNERTGRLLQPRDVRAEEQGQRLAQPFLNQLGPDIAARQLQRVKDAAKVVNQEGGNLSKRQLDLQGVTDKNTTQQLIESQANFQIFLGDLNKGITQQMQASTAFLEKSAELTKALNSFDGRLTIERNGKIEVIINGGAILQSMKGDIEKDVMQAVLDQFKEEVAKALKNTRAR